MDTKAKKHRTTDAIDLHWSHLGVAYRITTWPDVRIQRFEGDGWESIEAEEEELASGIVEVDAEMWHRYLGFVPPAERTFLQRFEYGKLAALLMLARGPGLLADLEEIPALVPFLAAHSSLRGMDHSHWEEVAVVHERGGVYALLEWLGLPARRETLLVLQNMVDPDVPRRLLEPLRRMLWRPIELFVLQHTPELTDRQLAQYCRKLAA